MRTLKIATILPAVFLLIVLTGCPPRVTVTVSPEAVTLDMGATEQLAATSTSSNDTSFSWTSTDESVATVSSTGLVLGVGTGTATIRATGSSSGAVGEATVTVTEEGTAPLSPLALAVDPAVDPIIESLPALTEAGAARPIAAVIDERGRQAEFVENELLLITDDMAALNAFVDRWQGVILMQVDPAAANMAMEPAYLIQINTDLADAAELEADLLALDPDARGAVRVSSQDGLNLLAAGAEEAIGGLSVGVNWVGRGASLATRSTVEAANGPNGFNSAGSGYSSNAFNWNFLDAGSTQDIGVTEAWWLLAQTGRLDVEVPIAILDMGFAPMTNEDIRSDWTAISNVPFFDAVGTANLGSCGGTPCPWHGTNVANAAMGVPDNGFGAAGPAGPIARPILIFTSYDFFTGIAAIVEALVEGARIINMSYSADVPAILSWSVIPFEIATSSVSNALLFAAAGNDGRNVDAEDCFIVCWEESWITPCENNGVICVGGIALNSRNRATNSNFGPRDVDIFAPYTVLVGPDPTTNANAQRADGTSVASPYAAGVAALIWAANPSLTAGQVRNILFDTAHSSPDGRVNRYVNAFAAVAQALGSVINIQQPAPGTTVQAGSNLTFQAFVAEGGRGTPTVTWSSTIGGVIGTGTSLTTNALAAGSHTVTATAAFTDGFTASDTVTVNVQNTPPTVRIDSPLDGASYFAGQPVPLTGTSFDPNIPPLFRLADAQVSWFVDGVFRANGHAHTIPAGTLALGARTIRFEGTDGIETASDQVSITILANPADLPPNVVNITNPAQGASFLADQEDGRGWYYQLTLTGNASDPEDGVLTGSSLRWTTSIEGGPPEDLGTGASLSVRLYAPTCFGNAHVITLTAEDSAGNETATTVTINVSQFCK
jgi:serine protease